MRVYLDTCTLQRPFDDQTQPRIRVETEAVFAILALTQARELTLLISDALDYEASRIPDEQRKKEISSVFLFAGEYLIITEEVQTLAKSLENQGIRAMDAVHIALATTAKADFFITCDDKLLRKSKKVIDSLCQVVSPLGFVSEVIK